MNEYSEAIALAAAALTAAEPTVTGGGSGLASSPILRQATALATTNRERQVIALVAAYSAGDTDRVAVLARDHLADHPGDPLVLRLATLNAPDPLEKP